MKRNDKDLSANIELILRVRTKWTIILEDFQGPELARSRQ
jgi:hypothetical protein